MPQKTPLSKQTAHIYSLLLSKGPMSAVELGKKLEIFPHAVYRSTKQLQALGCINQSGKHPALFEAIPVTDSVEAFTMLQRDLFLNTFAGDTLEKKTLSQDLNITFIESREMMFEKALSDINNTKDEMDNLASGDELPAEIMLAQKKALDRGVKIRTLFQKRNEKNESFIKARVKMGEQIRLSQPLNARIVIFDKRIVYIMSHDPSNYIKSMGIRFEYGPLGQLMYQQFLQYWDKGTALSAERREAQETAVVARQFLGATNSAADVAAALMLQYAPISADQKIDKALKIQRTVELDNAAAAAIKAVFDDLPIGTNVDACEGKKEAGKDGEEVDVLSGHHGTLTGKQYSVILDPIEGTTAACKRAEGATSMLAFSDQGGLVPTPMLSEFITLPAGVEDGEVTYMNKLIASAEAVDALDISRDAAYNVDAMVRVYNGADKVNIVVMNRPTNQHIIDAAQASGVEVTLIEAGDLLPSLAAVTGTLADGKHIVVYGRGGDQEGRIAAAAAKVMGGFMEGQVWIPREDDKNKTIDGLPVYSRDQLAPGKAENTGVVFTALTNESTYFGLKGRDGGADTLQQATSMAIVHPDVATVLREQADPTVDLRILSK